MEKLKLLTGLLCKLRYEITTNKPVTLLSFSMIQRKVDDLEQWNVILGKHGVSLESLDNNDKEDRTAHPTWYSLPWLLTECYLYRRVCDLVMMSDLSNFDPFMMKKRAALEASVTAVQQFLTHLSETQTLDLGDVGASFDIFLQGSLWANEFDLSLHPDQSRLTTNVATDLPSYVRHMSNQLVVNDMATIFTTWSNRIRDLRANASSSSCTERSLHTTSIVLDNAGPELLADLCFAEFILHHNLTDRVYLYPKLMPWFVSDVTPADLDWILNTGLTSVPFGADFYRRWATAFRQRFDSGQFVIRSSKFWTLPCTFDELQAVDKALYEELVSTDVVIFKGDLNYRKLLADRQWIPDNMAHKVQAFTPLQFGRPCSPNTTDACGHMIQNAVSIGQPIPCHCFSSASRAPLVFALRVCKSDVAVGLKTDVLQHVRGCSEDWWTIGRYGMIQIISPIRLE